MKKEERLHRLFGDIDDDLVAEVANQPIPIKVWLLRVTAAAAAVALTVGIAVAQPWKNEQPPITTGTTDGNHTTTLSQTEKATEMGSASISSTTAVKSTNTTHDNTTKKPTVTTILGSTPTTTTPTGGTPTSTVATESGIWYEPKWEEKPIWQQFPEFERFEIGSYTLRDITIDQGMVEEYLEDVNLHGYDIYTETGYDIVGKVYRIKGINPDCAVALQYPNRTDFFPAVCSQYFPVTLGDFIDDLSLREHLRVGTVYHSYRDTNGTLHDKEYAGLTVEKVWEMLLCDDALYNEYDEKKWQAQWNTKISIRIDMPLLGYENISISLSEDGYLRTNLLDTEKLFYIGEDKVDAFMAYVEKHCRLQKDDELIPTPDDTNASNRATTISKPAQPPLQTGSTAN